MAKNWLQGRLPRSETIQNNRVLKIFGKLLYRPYLWYFNRRAITKAASIGLFITYLPFPGHMIVAALCCLLWRANLPITMVLVWVVNPFTLIPLYGLAYLVGAIALGQSPQELEWSLALFQELWQPFLLGCFICGALLAISGNLTIRLAWRLNVSNQWRKRQKRMTSTIAY